MKLRRYNNKFRRDEGVQFSVGDSEVKPTAATTERQQNAGCGRCDTSCQTVWQHVSYAMILGWAEWDGERCPRLAGTVR
jgi:hypothetical protein